MSINLESLHGAFLAVLLDCQWHTVVLLILSTFEKYHENEQECESFDQCAECSQEVEKYSWLFTSKEIENRRPAAQAQSFLQDKFPKYYEGNHLENRVSKLFIHARRIFIWRQNLLLSITEWRRRLGEQKPQYAILTLRSVRL